MASAAHRCAAEHRLRITDLDEWQEYTERMYIGIEILFKPVSAKMKVCRDLSCTSSAEKLHYSSLCCYDDFPCSGVWLEQYKADEC
jgi:hypothetical protein